MNIDAPEIACLEGLPIEMIYTILGFLHFWEIKRLSCTSKRLREVCMPILFRRVKFEFSLDGIKGLKCLLKSNARRYVTCFTYEVRQLLKTEILDFSTFRSDILTPDSYVDMAKERYDENEDTDGFPSYMAVYETVRDICMEQQRIIDDRADLLLSSVFCALPLLKEVKLSFDEALEYDNCLLIPDIVKDEFYQYHLQVATSAIQTARKRGVDINTISLYDYKLPYFNIWEEIDLTSISESLSRLLEDVRVLRLHGSECVLRLLSRCALGLHQFDMCRVEAEESALKDFLEANKKTIRSIGFHETHLHTVSSHLRSSSLPVTASILRDMIGVPPSTPCRADNCNCLPWRKEASRLAIDIN